MLPLSGLRFGAMIDGRHIGTYPCVLLALAARGCRAGRRFFGTRRVRGQPAVAARGAARTAFC